MDGGGDRAGARGTPGTGAGLLQPCRATREAQERWWHIQLKANRQTQPSDGWHQHPATKGVTWRHPNPLLETLLSGGTGYLRFWSREQFKREGRQNKIKRIVFLALCLGNVYLDRLDSFNNL